MKVVQINVICENGSTGKICTSVSKLLTNQGIENYILYSSGKSDYSLGRAYMSDLDAKIQALKSRIFANYGFNSMKATRNLIRELERIHPDIVHLHNLHGHNCHLGLLFSYFKKKNIKLFWTFHDCWAFTGYCTHYDMVGCGKWREGCFQCMQRKHYSWIFDRSADLYARKNQLFQNLDLSIITPSHWLARQVRDSFLRNYPVKVIHNGIDLTIFRPTDSHFRKNYDCQDKFLILGVSFGWGQRKGLDVFIKLGEVLDDRFRIVLVGTDDKVDRLLPDKVISIHRTNDQKELAQIYSAANLLVNPTREENFPTVHLESLACGTPILSFDTGGCRETFDESCGCHVPKNDFDALFAEIYRIYEDRPFSREACTRYSTRFDMGECFKHYVEEYL